MFDSLPTAMSPSEELIKSLCARAIAAEDGDFAAVTAELHAALKAHIQGLRALAAAALVNPRPPGDLPPA
jgi:hypothetical protein